MRMRTAFQEEAASILRLKAGSEPGEELGWGKRFRKSKEKNVTRLLQGARPEGQGCAGQLRRGWAPGYRKQSQSRGMQLA